MNSDLRINSAYLDEVMNDPNQLKAYENENDLYKSSLSLTTKQEEKIEGVRHTVNQNVKKVLNEMDKGHIRLHYTCDEVLNEIDNKFKEIQGLADTCVNETKEDLNTIRGAKESVVQEAKEILKLGENEPPLNLTLARETIAKDIEQSLYSKNCLTSLVQYFRRILFPTKKVVTTIP